jgi:hypothetical protein
MQTFLPFKSFRRSAAALDGKRLSNQRRECQVLLNGGWANHPAAKMWRGCFGTLARYAYVISAECVKRGYSDSRPIFRRYIEKFKDQCANPKWLGKRVFHRSHRMNLLRKDHEHYAKFFTDDAKTDKSEIEVFPYYWPKP